MRGDGHGAPLEGTVRTRPLLVLLRGPIGAGKTTLLKGWEGRPPWRFFALEGDAAEAHHPADPTGEWLDQEGDTEIDILGLHARLVLGRGLNLLVDAGMLLTASKVDRFLRRTHRTRTDPRVVLLRLSVSTPEAVRRKTTLRPAYVRASHRGWVTRPIRGEIVLETTGRSERQVRREATEALALRAGRPPATPDRARREAPAPSGPKRRAARARGARTRRTPVEGTPRRGNAYR